MNTELEKLIELALVDGVLTEKEKAVLLKKAIELNVDIDEFEMILDAHFQKSQKAKSNNVNKNTAIKCPNCNDVIPPLSKVCSSCDYIIDSTTSNDKSHKGLEEAISEIEDALVKIKSIKQYTIFTSLLKHSYITLPILSLILIIISIRLDNSIWVIGLVTGVIGWRIIKRKTKVEINRDEIESYNSLKAEFEKKIRNANTHFGQNKRISTLINELNKELLKIDIQKKKSTNNETILYSTLIILTVCVYFIPQSKTTAEIIDLEMPIVIKSDELIQNGNINEVNKLLTEIESTENKVLIRSKIQLYNLNKELDKVELKIKNKSYSEAELSLSKVLWQKISADYNTISIERSIYKVFLARKAALNNILPKKYQIEIENEYSL